ncbi:MAG: lipopolysaccharide biosynthesis protein [Eubacteriales bacterium]|nr:lipopolysaccharide biosynthesis protein [Eubacteriales bacterium]
MARIRKRKSNKRETAAGESRASYLWNSAAGLLNAAQSVFLLMVITRMSGLYAAGIFSIAFATGNLLLNLGNYGVRNYQVSDVGEECSFFDYLVHRLCTAGLMAVAALGYYVYCLEGKGYTPYKAQVVLAMCLLKTVDVLEEVFDGRLQQRGRLDLAGKVVTARLLVTMAVMLGVLGGTGDLRLATVLAGAAAALTSGLGLWLVRGALALPARGACPAQIRKLFIACFPVCATNFLSFYLTNSPKYAIDSLMDETAQAQYNFIAMPVFVIGLLNLFLYQPVLVRMTLTWNGKEKEAFRRLFFRILAGLGVISCLVLAGAWVMGIPVLSALYATDLSALHAELMVILAGGAVLAYNGFLCAVLTITRSQKAIPVIYAAAAALALYFVPEMVERAGIYGAVAAYTGLMVLIALLLTALFGRVYRRQMCGRQ